VRKSGMLATVALLAAVACTANTSSGSTTSLSSSPTAVVVPDVVGLSPSMARDRVEGAGLSEHVSVVTGPYPTAAIVRQRPQGGTVVPPGSKVRLVIGPAGVAGD
jgi:beta-lactam-binding protein with PASTA domain